MVFLVVLVALVCLTYKVQVCLAVALVCLAYKVRVCLAVAGESLLAGDDDGGGDDSRIELQR